jgi:hypothetical protein
VKSADDPPEAHCADGDRSVLPKSPVLDDGEAANATTDAVSVDDHAAAAVGAGTSTSARNTPAV